MGMKTFRGYCHSKPPAYGGETLYLMPLYLRLVALYATITTYGTTRFLDK